MKPSFKIRTALRLADRLGTRARELRRDLRDHVRSESFRIQEAEKRARGPAPLRRLVEKSATPSGT